MITKTLPTILLPILIFGVFIGCGDNLTDEQTILKKIVSTSPIDTNQTSLTWWQKQEIGYVSEYDLDFIKIYNEDADRPKALFIYSSPTLELWNKVSKTLYFDLEHHSHDKHSGEFEKDGKSVFDAPYCNACEKRHNLEWRPLSEWVDEFQISNAGIVLAASNNKENFSLRAILVNPSESQERYYRKQLRIARLLRGYKNFVSKYNPIKFLIRPESIISTFSRLANYNFSERDLAFILAYCQNPQGKIDWNLAHQPDEWLQILKQRKSTDICIKSNDGLGLIQTKVLYLDPISNEDDYRTRFLLRSIDEKTVTQYLAEAERLYNLE